MALLMRLVVLLAIAGCPSDKREGAATSAPAEPAIPIASAPASPVPDTRPPIEVKASALVGAFEDNQVRAEANYLHRRVLVDGQIDRIWKRDEYTLVEIEGRGFDEMQCVHVGGDAALVDRRKGQRVIVSGMVTGYEPLLGVIVADCRVERWWDGSVAWSREPTASSAVDALVKRLEFFRDRMCRCKTLACADGTLEEFDADSRRQMDALKAAADRGEHVSQIAALITGQNEAVEALLAEIKRCRKRNVVKGE